MNPSEVLSVARAMGFSLRDLAALLGVSQQTVFNWSHGTYTPGPQRHEPLHRLAKLLVQVPPDERAQLRHGKTRRAWVDRHRQG